ncbi:hypothetical protein V5799_014746 [Amblyomma americanum]|uniref:Uncharacterized protein n=1 Tax=Amblyomma americanum TaxID=6943 RepID=A0AAQ4E249_AMBAM
MSESFRRDSNLTLDTALANGRLKETIQRQQELGPTEEESEAWAVARKTTPGASTYCNSDIRQPTGRAVQKSDEDLQRCRFCGRSYQPRLKCPARAVWCNSCRAKGHFAVVSIDTPLTMRKSDSTITSENHITSTAHSHQEIGLTSTSGNLTSHPHREIGHHIHITKCDITTTSGNRTAQSHQKITSHPQHIHIRKSDSHPHQEITHHIHIRKSDITSTSGNRTSHPHQKIRRHIHIEKSDITSTSQNVTSQPRQEIGHHIHIRKSDITSASGNRTSHPHQEIRHHIRIRKSDITFTSGNRTSHSHHEIGHHIHIIKSDITFTS